VAFVGSQWTAPNVDSDWYRELAKPSWQPPSWAFAPVWTALYLAMGVAAWRVWLTNRKAGGVAVPLVLWTTQLGLNLAWTYAFFERRSPVSGVVVIVALWLAIVATIVAFAPKSRLAALLMSPYLAWVTFAMALNISIWQMN
jgi:tryptophan-rich sensory protein